MPEKKLKILLVGQTPPPFGGQALMIERTLKGRYGEHIRIIHVRMRFSKDAAEIGRVNRNKIIELIRIIIKIIQAVIVHRPQVIYYFPAGPNTVPILRDIVILGCTRWLFQKTIFHFRASGLSEYFKGAPAWIKLLMRIVYFNPDIAIRLSEFCPQDGKFVHAKQEFILLNGIEDPGENTNNNSDCLPSEKEYVDMIFLGVLTPTKGIDTLLQACAHLAERKLRFKLSLIGEFDTFAYEQYITRTIEQRNLSNYVQIRGVLTGEKKKEAYLSGDILCAPTYFHSEALPGVIIEAMSYSLPVVATNWRGIPSLIQEGYNGFMVNIKDSLALAEKLEILIRDPILRKKMGGNGRRLFLEKFTLDKYYNNLRAIFEKIIVR